MLHTSSRWMMAVACAIAFLSTAAGQDEKPAEPPKKPGAPGAPADQEAPAKPAKATPETIYRESVLKRAEQEYRQLYKRPETPAEYWTAIKYEIEVGRFALAAELIKGLLESTKEERVKDLLPLEEQDGLSAFLRLRVVPSWVNDPNLDKAIRDKINREAKANVEELIARVTSVVQKFLTDPVRVQHLIKTLGESDEDRTFAVKELKRSGALVVPYLLEALQQTPTTEEMHQILMNTLVQLDKNAQPPLLAALDLGDGGFKIELIDILKKRADPSAVPPLYHIAAAPQSGASKAAADAIAYFLGTPQIPAAKVALTQEAERYYQHKVPLGDQPVVIWQANNNQLTSTTVTPTQAEEYYALLYARQALAIDPTYQPAQVVFLSAALDKGFERGGINQPLDKGAPAVKELMRVVDADLLKAVLRRALRDNRVPVILGAVRALGDRGEVSAALPESRRPALLVQALDYPDRRVELAAADALLRMPGHFDYGAKSRVVEVLRRALGGTAGASILIGDGNQGRANAVARSLRQAGYTTVAVRSGREVMSRLNQSSDIDLVLVDSSIPYPELPFLLGQMRADVHSGLLPVVVTVPERTLANGTQQDHLQQMVDHYRNVWIMPVTYAPENLKVAVASHLSDAGTKALSEDERKAAAGLAMYWLKRMATGETPGYDIRPAEAEILNALNSDDLAFLAVEAVARLHNPDAQRSLARVVLDAARRPELRAAAAYELARAIGQYGPRVTTAQRDAIDKLFHSLGDDPKQRSLKENVALVLGGFHPTNEQTGARLRQFAPPLGSTLPAVTPEKPEAPADKDKGDSDKDK